MATANIQPRHEPAIIQQHMVQLDGLRAFAVFAVVLWHYSEGSFVHDLVQWGFLGVRLFFVLSGFLITRILLDCRDKVDAYGFSTWYTVKNFYIRRFLRIFPIYYLFVLAMFLGLPIVRENIWWYLSYCQNIRFAMENKFLAGPHLWTLAVEEQFYLFWPFMILFLPRRQLPAWIILSVLAGPFTRWLLLSLGWSPFAAMLMTPSNLDTLGMGALLAWMMKNKPGEPTEKFMKFSLWAGLPLLVLYIAMQNLGLERTTKEAPTSGESFLFVFGDVALSFLSTWLIYRGAVGFTGVTGRILSLSPITYIGKISYGIYIYHHAVFVTLSEIVFPRLGIEIPNYVVLNLLVFGSVSVAISAASWHLFEKPLNDFKKYFPYAPRDANAKAGQNADPDNLDGKNRHQPSNAG
ncbi:MAG: hypothetical protein CMJ46_14065 [Planctomyces sp.]|nr:hypothetical protein [Planctomyces sp.]